eukprot:CAMPEP_0172304196 /NCGR_PEP_ID=MMETSP1058-20130122/5628_1 /TAXON_ID=83371 /ORGANISM="Detonula confervacea, Strain CCMP 353" /LENGTH=431 /DNA_ID=CAMNT_0013015321 /DNA_START=305 /DNA_END=1600 /DNA_ORIENTATION=+
MHYSSRSKTLALLPKFTGFLSLLGSTFIFQDVVFHKTPTHRVYHRLVLGLSISDMVASVVNILSTWPIPEGTEGVYLASGTTQTCTAQGFFNELGNLATPLYNASLCAYYVLVTRNNWMEARIRSKAEPLMHILPVAISSTIAVLGLPFKLYNNSGWLCWIATYPSGCQATDTCTRGENADIFRWVHYAIIWSAILLVTAGMYSIYRMVKRQELIQSQEMNAEVVYRGTKSKKVAIQAALFVGALYLTWIFTTITRIYQIATGNNSYVLLVLMAIFFPLQGFFNCLVYLRPRYLRSKSRNRDATVRRLMYLTLHHESHPIHGLQNMNRRGHQEVDERGRRRSLTASYYSMGNSKFRANSIGESGADNSCDASYSINTVNAIASASDYNSEAIEQPTDDRVAQPTDIRATLDAVDETRTTSDTPDIQELVNK